MSGLIDIFKQEINERTKKIILGLQTKDKDTVLRELHGLKGTSKMMGFETIGNIIHEMEDSIKNDGLTTNTINMTRKFIISLPMAVDTNNPNILSEILSKKIDEEISIRTSDLININIHNMHAAIGFLVDALSFPDVENTRKYIRKGIKELYKMMLLPVNDLIKQLKKEGEQISNDLSKNIVFHIETNIVSIDRNLAETIMDISIHLIRNAIDHGIELPEDRLKKGKSSEGHIIIKLKKDIDKIVLSVEDDGQGIDLEELKRKYPNKKTTPENLIFEDGITLKNTATKISGRGMGLADIRSVVRSNGGDIKMETEKNTYTRFIISLPYIMFTNIYHIFKDTNTLIGLATNDVSYVEPSTQNNIVVHLKNNKTISFENYITKLERHIYKLPAIFNPSPYIGWFLYAYKPCFVLDIKKL